MPLQQTQAAASAEPLPTPPNILLCTLGASWAVIPEILGWLAPDTLDLYAHHQQRDVLDALRDSHALLPPDEIWVCSTEGSQTQKSLAYLHQWHQLVQSRLSRPLPLRVWTARGCDQLANQQECEHMRELTLRVCLLAKSHTGNSGQLLLSLAGGRKTMSADLQTAGNLFGAAASLHVVGAEPMPAALTGRLPEHAQALPALLAAALPAELASAVMPLVASKGQYYELLDVAVNGDTVQTQAYPLPLAQTDAAVSWQGDGRSLYADIEQRQRSSVELMSNFISDYTQTPGYSNWRSLNRLPPAHITHLHHTRLQPQHLPWLRALPKSDLHRHIGGCLSLAQQKEVARAIHDATDRESWQQAVADVRPLLESTEWDWNWPKQLRQPQPQPQRHTESDTPLHDNPNSNPNNTQNSNRYIRSQRTAAVLLHASEQQLQHNLWQVTQPRIALKTQHLHGFAAYERPGELSGSALLENPHAIAAYASALVAQAHSEGLTYAELRGSPHKYSSQPVQWLQNFRQALEKAGALVSNASAENHGNNNKDSSSNSSNNSSSNDNTVRLGFIWIIDRRQPDTIRQTVEQAVRASKDMPDFLLGLDMAGDEATHNPQQLAPHFMPAFEQCLAMTIHAGEGEAADSIWQAAYHLHADRIGHGLTLAQHPGLAQRFRNRGICLELCPSSNREVVGFYDPQYADSQNLPRYPLRDFIDSGLHLAICTDNPGISQTSIDQEYLTAARMTDGGLSLWEVLILIRQSFTHAFLPAAEKDQLLRQTDLRIFNGLQQKIQ